MSTRTDIAATVTIVGIGALIVLLVLGVLWYRHSQQQKSVAPAVPKTSMIVPSLGTGEGGGPGKYWHHGSVLLPNPKISPGEVRTTDLSIVCGESAQDFRDTSDSLKRRVYADYDEAPHERDCHDTTRMTKGSKKHPPHEVTEACEVDHIVSLELGGADTEANLFPQPYNMPDGMGAHAKDRVENYLHNQVCYHSYPLAEAQKKIATDWYQVYLDAHLSQ